MRKIDKKQLHSIFAEMQNSKEMAFNKLYKNYKDLVYGASFSILKNKEDSEDVVQNVFSKIFKLEKEKLPNENEATWLYAITKNEALNFLRKKKQEINLDEIYYISEEESELNKIIEKDTYNKMISKLNEKEQEIISLKILSNLSFKDISKILNIPIGTVQWRYYKGVHTLKILLSSLSMYIVTICILVMQKTRKSFIKQSNMEEIPKQEDETEQETAKKEEQTKSETLRGDENNTSMDTETEKIENVVTVPEENISITLVDIGLISISGIFLIITVTFMVIFIKHQQKVNKKVSK